jgi:hypothetical protein
MVEQLGVVTARTQRFDKAASLPVGAVVDALVEGENTHLRSRRHDEAMAVRAYRSVF